MYQEIDTFGKLVGLRFPFFCVQKCKNVVNDI